jgi:P-type Ca2+ transporter type 2C
MDAAHIRTQAYRQEPAEIAIALRVDLKNGLTTQEANTRLAKNGLNELVSLPPIPAWRRILAQFQDPLIYLLLVAIAIALVAWGVEGWVGYPIDAIVITIVVILNGALGYLEEAKARDAVAALARMTEATSGVMRNGHLVRLPSAQLVVGDVLVLAEGDSVGADARLIQVASLRVQEASLTGESESVMKDLAMLPSAAAIGDQLNMVFKGTAVVQGTGHAIVTATGMATEMGAIASLLTATPEEPTPLEKEIRRIGRLLGLAVVIISTVVVCTILLVSDIQSISDVVTVLLFGVALAVAAVPEGLPAILSVVLALGVRRMAKRNAIVKKLSSVEALGATTVIATDKTGTLTRAEMTIEQIVTASGSTLVTGVGYSPDGHIEVGGQKMGGGALLVEQTALLMYGCLANNATLRQTKDTAPKAAPAGESHGEWKIQGDPTEAAFLVAERKLGTTELRIKRFTRMGEIAFTSVRKMMSTLQIDHDHSDAAILITKGAPDMLLKRCSHLQVGIQTVALDEVRRREILTQVDALSDSALRTLGVAFRPLASNETPQANEPPKDDLEHGLVWVGIVGMMDPPREKAAVAIREARRAGIRVIMITGDHPRTAMRIASDLGINEKGQTVLSGLELDGLDDAAFAAAVQKTSVYARVSPKHKLRIVAALQAQGQVVAMTGDGVNDAPALKAADIGVAMGITGTEVTKEAAKVILADDNFATIVDAVREGRSLFDNIRKFLRYLLSSNMGEVLTVFLGVVGAGVIGLHLPADGGGALVLPLLATQILWLNLITDSWPALAMGIDPPTDDVMARKPRHMNERVIGMHMWAGVFEIGLVIAIVALLTMDMYLPGGLIAPVGGTGEIANARTAGFTVLVMAHLFQCFNSRSENSSAFKDLFANPWLWGAVTVSALLQVAVIQVPFLNLAFGTTPLALDQWLICLGMASLVLVYSEVRKFMTRLIINKPTTPTAQLHQSSAVAATDQTKPANAETVSKENANSVAVSPAKTSKSGIKSITPRTWLKICMAALLIILLALYLLRNVLFGTSINVYAASGGELVQSVSAIGRVISPQRITIALLSPGRVLRVAVAEGQSVERGQLLIELDNSDSRASLAQASAAVAQSLAKLQQLGELSKPQAQQTLAQAQATALQTHKSLVRSRDLFAQGFVSQAEVDDAQRADQVAISQVASAQAQVKSNTPSGSDAAIAQTAYAQAVAGEQLARVKLAQGQVLAPSSGVLISRSVEVGDIVQSGKALMVLATSGQTQISVQIDEKNLSKIALTQPAYVSADAFASQRFDAIVAYINPAIDATRGSVEVKLNVINPPMYLRQDMTVSVDIETARRTVTVFIAASTIEDASTEKPWVLVVRHKRAVKQYVKLGLRGDTRVEVLEGITAGEGVVPVSKISVKADQRVRAKVIDIPAVTP